MDEPQFKIGEVIFVPLPNVTVGIGHSQADPSQQLLLIGPVTMLVTITKPLRVALLESLRGIKIATAEDLPK